MAIQLSLSQFYKEVTGSKTGGMTTIKPSLKRWGVEWDETKPPKTRCIGIDQLPAAKRAYKADRAAHREVMAASAAKMREAKAAKRAANGGAKIANEPTFAAILARLIAVEELLQSLGVTIENINARTFRWEKDQARTAAAALAKKV